MTAIDKSPKAVNIKSRVFKDLVLSSVKAPYHGRILCLDPGETTGVAVFHDQHLVVVGQIRTKNLKLAGEDFERLLEKHKPHIVVVEDYRVYSWKTKQHEWSALYTPKLIGFIEGFLAMYPLPMVKQMAHQAKYFCTDDRLKEWDFYVKGQPHARDAIRHGCYYLLFKGQKPSTRKPKQ